MPSAPWQHTAQHFRSLRQVQETNHSGKEPPFSAVGNTSVRETLRHCTEDTKSPLEVERAWFFLRALVVPMHLPLATSTSPHACRFRRLSCGYHCQHSCEQNGLNSGRAIAQAVRQWPLTAETGVQSWVTTRELLCSRSFPLVINITPLLKSRLSVFPEVCHSPDQTQCYHILGL